MHLGVLRTVGNVYHQPRPGSDTRVFALFAETLVVPGCGEQLMQTQRWAGGGSVADRRDPSLFVRVSVCT